MDLSKLSITELKALKCDVYETLQQAQYNLQVISTEIEKRKKENEGNKEEIETVKKIKNPKSS